MNLTNQNIFLNLLLTVFCFFNTAYASHEEYPNATIAEPNTNEVLGLDGTKYLVTWEKPRVGDASVKFPSCDVPVINELLKIANRTGVALDPNSIQFVGTANDIHSLNPFSTKPRYGRYKAKVGFEGRSETVGVNFAFIRGQGCYVYPSVPNSVQEIQVSCMKANRVYSRHDGGCI